MFQTKEDFVKHYEKEANTYDMARGKTADGLWVANQEIFFLLENLNLKQESTILEAGCGTGRILLPLAMKGYKCFGIDPSRRMLNIAHRKDVAGFLNNHLFIGDIENIPFSDNMFDAVYTINVLQWLPDGFEKSFQEMYRVAKNGAIIILDFPNKNSLWRIIKRTIHWKKEANRSYSKEELENYFKNTTKNNFVIKSNFSYPQKLFRYRLFYSLISFIEKTFTLPMKLRTKFYVIITKNKGRAK